MHTPSLRLPLLASLAWLGMLAAHAQPQWRFHLAFEDGSGARDTLWFIYDTTATTGATVDYELGEGPMPMGDGAFHVYALNAQGDSATTIAWPYTMYPHFNTYNTIGAINWVPPMTIRWDTSLFHAPYLPYEQGSIGAARMDGTVFFFVNNHPELQAYNMLIDDSVVVSEFWDYLFPFGVSFFLNDGLGVSEGRASATIGVCPNPATTELFIEGHGRYTTVWITDAMGRMVRSIDQHDAATPIDVSGLAAGTYHLRMTTTNTQYYHATFQKLD